MIDESKLESYWNDIPIGKENAWSYATLCTIWGRDKRTCREIMHQLSRYDNGDDLILIRSSNGNGFYRTNDPDEIKAYRAECLNRGRNTLAPLKKIDRVLKPEDGQLNITNNLRAVRVSCGKSAAEVCREMQIFDPGFDTPMLSRMENDRCLPTFMQLNHLAAVYKCSPHDLIPFDMLTTVYT